MGDDLRLVPGDDPVAEQRHGPGQLDRQVVREVQQAVHRVPGLPQGRCQLGPGEFVPRLRHARRALRSAAGRGAPPDQLGDRGVLQRRRGGLAAVGGADDPEQLVVADAAEPVIVTGGPVGVPEQYRAAGGHVERLPGGERSAGA